MRQLFTGLVAAAAFGLFASVAQADCQGHGVTADAGSDKTTVSISTHDDAAAPVAIESEATAEAAPEPVCADGAENCKAATK